MKLLVLLTFFIVGCSSKIKEQENSYKKREIAPTKLRETLHPIAVDTIINNIKEDSIKPSLSTQGVYVGSIKEFEVFNGYYITVFQNEKWSYDLYNQLITRDTSILFIEEDDIKRTKLNEKLSKEILNVEQLDTLIVFNQNMVVVDTLYRNSFELYDDWIESKIVASYNSSVEIDNNLVVSKNINLPEEIQVPTFFNDSTYQNHLLIKNELAINHIFHSVGFLINKDTCYHISYSDTSENTYNFYKTWFLNGEIINSEKNTDVLIDIRPTPLSNDSNIVFLCLNGIPDTDHIWESIIEWNTNSWKVRRLKQQRYIKEVRK